MTAPWMFVRLNNLHHGDERSVTLSLALNRNRNRCLEQFLACRCLAALCASLFGLVLSAAEPDLVGHWKLRGDCQDSSGHGNHGANHGVDLQDGAFDGAHAYIEVPTSDSLKLGIDDFAICAWIYTDEQLDDIVGD